MRGEVSRIDCSKIRIFKNCYSRSSCIERCPDFETEYTGSSPRSAPGLWVEWILGWVKVHKDCLGIQRSCVNLILVRLMCSVDVPVDKEMNIYARYSKAVSSSVILSRI
jgi:hypothetical protein